MSDDWFDQFYDRALPVVYGYFLRRCGGRKHVAEDLTQETFLSAIRSLDRSPEIDAPLPWLVSIARRRLVDYYRRQRRRRERGPSLLYHDNLLSDESSSLTTLVEARLITALDGVPKDQRLALILRYVDGLPVAEVARLLDRSQSATESLIRRGRKSLQEAYEEASIE